MKGYQRLIGMVLVLLVAAGCGVSGGPKRTESRKTVDLTTAGQQISRSVYQTPASEDAGSGQQSGVSAGTESKTQEEPGAQIIARSRSQVSDAEKESILQEVTKELDATIHGINSLDDVTVQDLQE